MILFPAGLKRYLRLLVKFDEAAAGASLSHSTSADGTQPQKSIDELLAEIVGPDVSGSGGGKGGRKKGKQHKKQKRSGSTSAVAAPAVVPAAMIVPSDSTSSKATKGTRTDVLSPAVISAVGRSGTPSSSNVASRAAGTIQSASLAASPADIRPSREQLLREIARAQSQLSDVGASVERLQQQQLKSADEQHTVYLQAARLAAFQRGPAVKAEINSAISQRSELESCLSSLVLQQKQLQTERECVPSAPLPTATSGKRSSMPAAVDIKSARSVLRRRLTETKREAAQLSASSAAAVAAVTASSEAAAVTLKRTINDTDNRIRELRAQSERTIVEVTQQANDYSHNLRVKVQSLLAAKDSELAPRQQALQTLRAQLQAQQRLSPVVSSANIELMVLRQAAEAQTSKDTCLLIIWGKTAACHSCSYIYRLALPWP